MPQMSPMWWTMIMYITMISLFMMISMNYFNFMKTIFFKKQSKKTEMKWSW